MRMRTSTGMRQHIAQVVQHRSETSYIMLGPYSGVILSGLTRGYDTFHSMLASSWASCERYRCRTMPK